MPTGLHGVMSMEIRRLEPADFNRGFFETLAALREPGLTADEACQILSNRPGNIRTFVLVSEGKIVSTATLMVEQKFIHRGGVVGHIEDVATHPAFRGRGFARALIQYLIDAARAEGCYKVILNCDPDKTDFYGSLGFRPGAQCMRLDL